MEQKRPQEHIFIFPPKSQPVHLEFPPISLKDLDLKPQTFLNRHVNATDIVFGCYFLEGLEIFFCLNSVQKIKINMWCLLSQVD